MSLIDKCVFISNDEVQCRINQPSLTELSQAMCLTAMSASPNSVDTKQLLTASLPGTISDYIDGNSPKSP